MVNYRPLADVLMPISVEARNAELECYPIEPGCPGGAGFSMDLYVMPDVVSFQALEFEEVPSENSIIEGYFTNLALSSFWYHNEEMGAGCWHDIQGENYWFRDEAAMGDRLVMPCSDGRLVWNIPVVWREKDVPESVHPLNNVPQTFTMNSNGTLRVSKYGFWVERELSGVVHKTRGMQ